MANSNTEAVSGQEKVPGDARGPNDGPAGQINTDSTRSPPAGADLDETASNHPQGAEKDPVNDIGTTTPSHGLVRKTEGSSNAASLSTVQSSPRETPATIANQSNADDPKASPESELLSNLCTQSLITYIGNELPALRAHLNDDDLQQLHAFVTSHFAEFTRPRDQSLTAESNFLFENTESVCARLYLSLLREVRDRQTIPIRHLQLAGEVERLERAEGLDELITARREEIAAAAAAKEGEEKGGIGMLDGKVVFGPVAPGDAEDDGRDVMTGGNVVVNLDSLESMRRLLARK